MSFLVSHAVEISSFFAVLSLAIFFQGARTAVYDRICFDLAQDLKLNVKCHNLTSAPEEFHDGIRRENARYNTWDTISNTITPSVAGLILSARGDRIGRKQNFLLGYSSHLAVMALNAIVLNSHSFSIYTVPFVATFIGLAGTVSLSFTTAFQHIADITDNPADRTFQSARQGSVLMGAFTIGGFLASYLLSVSTAATMLQLSVILSVFALLASFWIENRPPKTVVTGKGSILHLITDIKSMLTKWRPENRRFYLHLALIYFFLGAPAFETTGPVFTLYFYEALSLKPQELGIYFALTGIASTIGSVLGSKILGGRGWHETEMIFLSTSTKVAEYVAITFATTFTHLLYTIPFGMLSMLLRPAYQTLISELVDSNEVGKVTSLQSVVLDLARLVIGLALNVLYVYTAKYVRCSIFYFLCLCCGISLIGMVNIGRNIGGKKVLE